VAAKALWEEAGSIKVFDELPRKLRH
jgi:hypothetical protein